MKVNRNAESVEHISSCQPNFLPETSYWLREGTYIELFLKILKSLLGIARQKRELVSCLCRGAAVSAAIADFGSPHVCQGNTMAAGKSQAACVCVGDLLFLFLPCGA